MQAPQPSPTGVEARPPETAAGGSSRAGEAEAPRAEARLDDVLAAWVERLDARRGPDGTTAGLPRLPAAPETSPQETAALLQRARRFHGGDPEAAAQLEPPGEDLLPALLHPFRDTARLRHGYPLLLFGPDGEPDRPLAGPLDEVLADLTGRIAPGDDEAPILKDNLRRLELHVRTTVDGTAAPADATRCLADAGASVEQALGLRGESARQLHADLQRLVEAVPARSALLGLSDDAPLHLFVHAASRRAARRRAALLAEVDDVAGRLRDLLRLYGAPAAGTKATDALADTVGAGGGHFDAAALARVLGRARGGAAVDETRRRRLEQAVAALDRFRGEPHPLVTVLHHRDEPPERLPADVHWRRVDAAEVAGGAAALFDEQAAAYAEAFAALRIARLELAGAYDPARHDPLWHAFDWRAFSQEELLRLPVVAAVIPEREVAGNGLHALSRLLLSGRPVNVIVPVRPAADPAAEAGADPLPGYRFEPAYLAVSHREAVVNQTSAARPQHLLDAFTRALAAARPAFHVIASDLDAAGAPPRVGAWLHGAAALEGRAHPLLHYDPTAGETWARRLDFSLNPQPQDDWPTYELPCEGPDGERRALSIPFTFADFLLADGCFREHFRVLPPELGEEHVVPLADALRGDPAEAVDRVPFVWAADAGGRLHRLAVSRRVAFACRDRLGFWRTLQELAGVRNAYVREAVERQRETMLAEFAGREARLREEHAQELDRLRESAAAETMARLARALLRADVAEVAASVAGEPPPPPPAEAAAPAAPAPPAPEAQAGPPPQEQVEAASEAAAEPEEEEAEEPWIDTALCTSCNDCLDINPRLFVYNANKQAVIGDPQAGTYEQLVRAAEKCPARCIHPGKPLNPDEPNLEELIERAKPFNV